MPRPIVNPIYRIFRKFSFNSNAGYIRGSAKAAGSYLSAVVDIASPSGRRTRSVDNSRGPVYR